MKISRKIIVIGCCGAGKSYFSRLLSNKTNIPVTHLDILYWNPNWVATPIEEFKEKINKVTNLDEFIIDGNYSKTLEDRFIKAETIIYLDIDAETCIKQEEARRGQKRPDLPEFLNEDYDPEFINFIRNFKNKDGLVIDFLINKYKDKQYVILHNIDEENEFLNSLELEEE